MLELEFTARDLAYTRFAFSPLWEVVAAVRVLKGDGHPLHAPWAEQAAARLVGFDWRLLGDLVPVPTRVIPGFVALAPFWPRILSLLEGDILHRARRLATGGATALFADLDPQVRWADDRLRLAHRQVTGRRGLRGQGLLMVPSVFVWPRIFSITVPGWQPTLRYPPRGIATLWEPRPSPTSSALAGVLGASRAALLSELDSPASTSELAGRTGLAAGGVSQHLTALRAAGLVNAHRTGRYVLYARTEVGESLIAAQR